MKLAESGFVFCFLLKLYCVICNGCVKKERGWKDYESETGSSLLANSRGGDAEEWGRGEKKQEKEEKGEVHRRVLMDAMRWTRCLPAPSGPIGL